MKSKLIHAPKQQLLKTLNTSTQRADSSTKKNTENQNSLSRPKSALQITQQRTSQPRKLNQPSLKAKVPPLQLQQKQRVPFVEKPTQQPCKRLNSSTLNSTRQKSDTQQSTFDTTTMMVTLTNRDKPTPDIHKNALSLTTYDPPAQVYGLQCPSHKRSHNKIRLSSPNTILLTKPSNLDLANYLQEEDSQQTIKVESEYATNKTVTGYNQSEMDEKVTQHQTVHQSVSMIRDITNVRNNLNLLKITTSDSSVTQFRMHTILATSPHKNNTLGTQTKIRSPKGLTQVLQVDLQSSQMIKNYNSTQGEENIKSEDTPHKQPQKQAQKPQLIQFMNEVSCKKLKELREPTFSPYHDAFDNFPKLSFHIPQQKSLASNISLLSIPETPSSNHFSQPKQQDISILNASSLILDDHLLVYQSVKSKSPEQPAPKGQHTRQQTSHIKIQEAFTIEQEQEDNSAECTPEKQQETVDIHKMHLIQTYNALQMIPQLKKYQKAYLDKDPVYLPPLKPGIKKTVIFDIDETMIHCLEDSSSIPDVIMKIPLDDGDFADAGINIRPHLYECLRQANEHYQVITFTASDQQYADAILDFLDPNRELIAHRLYRQHCIETFVDNGEESVRLGYVKDLRIIRNRALSDMVIVDNSVLSFLFQVDNGVPILPFYTNKQDEELVHLSFYLRCLAEQSLENKLGTDVRSHNREAFGLHKLIDADLDELLQQSNEKESVLSEPVVFTKRLSSHSVEESSDHPPPQILSRTSTSAKYYVNLPSEMEEINEESAESSELNSSMGGGSMFKFRRQSSRIIIINQNLGIGSTGSNMDYCD
ncbi:hypothetical protein FGO68_gene9050 [Halteria grandinella]|uniref:FCP1 homology domain-containing protein n=1 Tax=Halteria grandinella TaxID=5974 RepID=A0A8J8NWK9_HALGN|nr:hypothetical protein FGO68_gene9050 [Halteria grandinella]